MSSEESPSLVGESKEKIALDLTWNLLDCDTVLRENFPELPAAIALATLDKLIPAHDPSAGSVSLGFPYFTQKDLCRVEVEIHVDRAAHYKSKPTINAIHQAWLNILRSCSDLYTKSKRLCTKRGLNSRFKAVASNIPLIDLDSNAKYDDQE